MNALAPEPKTVTPNGKLGFGILPNKRYTSLLIIFLLAGAFDVRSDDAGRPADSSFVLGSVTVLAVSGNAKYLDAGQWGPLTAGMDLGCVTFRTAPDSYIDLQVNGSASVTRLLPNSTITIPVMRLAGATTNQDSETLIALDDGAIMEIAGPLSANSRLEVKTPKGVIGIRGQTQLILTVGPGGVSPRRVNATVTAGEVFASAVRSATQPAIVTKVAAGKSLDLSEPKVKPADPEVLNGLKQIFEQMKKEAGASH